MSRVTLLEEYSFQAYGMGRHYRSLMHWLPDKVANRGMTLTHIRLGLPGMPFKVSRSLARLGGQALGLAAGCPSVIHAGLAVPGWSGAPTRIVSLHDTVQINFADEAAFPPWTNDTLAKCGFVMTVSAAAASDIERHLGVDRAKIRVIPGGVDGTLFKPGPEMRSGVMVVAGRAQRKNLATLLNAWQTAGPAMNSILRVVGQTGPPLPRVEWMGHIDEATLASLYRTSTLVVVPSLHEGFGLPVLEAMSSGTPVLASRSSSLPEVGGAAAQYCDPLDASAWSKQMITICSDSSLLTTLSQRGIARAAEYSWERAADLLADLYYEAAG